MKRVVEGALGGGVGGGVGFCDKHLGERICMGASDWGKGKGVALQRQTGELLFH